ncbi:hypothetical protein D3C71_1205590 [compost metagenome]
MSFSMTGYGQSSRPYGGGEIRFEVKTVNHRYTEISLRVPREWTYFEDSLRKKVQEYVRRGRVDVAIIRELPEESGRPVLNRRAVRAYLDAAEILAKEFDISGELDLHGILSLPGVMDHDGEPPVEPMSSEELEKLLTGGLEESLRALSEMRAREGHFLAGDIAGKVDALEKLQREMQGLAPAVVTEYRDKLRQRLEHLRDGSFPFDEYKFGMEVAIFAERSNIDEELTRLQSHFEQCRALLLSDEPMGRKLDFLIQEMNRETNTIGSKCGHLAIGTRVLEMKALLEKIREQAANLE